MAQLLDVGDDELDVFGSKFFPAFPGGTTVGWHQDAYFFGTSAGQKVISCAVYLEATDAENGCLQVLPGSHLHGEIVPHAPGTGIWSQGEWAEVDSDKAVDVVVPAGSVVLFDARVLHAARQNRSVDRTRFSIFFHYVPGDFNFAWGDTDFARGVYADRHVAAPK